MEEKGGGRGKKCPELRAVINGRPLSWSFQRFNQQLGYYEPNFWS
jgi:hypothetical protein